MALHVCLAALEVGKVELTPAHAVAGDVVLYLVRVLKPVGHGVVQSVIFVDAHVGTPFCARDFVADQHENSPSRRESGGNALSRDKAAGRSRSSKTATCRRWRTIAAGGRGVRAGVCLLN